MAQGSKSAAVVAVADVVSIVAVVYPATLEFHSHRTAPQTDRTGETPIRRLVSMTHLFNASMFTFFLATVLAIWIFFGMLRGCYVIGFLHWSTFALVIV